MSTDKTKTARESKRGFDITKKWLPIAGTIVCALFLLYFISITFIYSALDDYKHTLFSGISYGRMEYEHNVQKDDLYYTSNKELMQDLTGFTAFVYEENGYSSDVRDELVIDVGSYSYYFFYRGSIDNDTKTCTGYFNNESRSKVSPNLNDEELYTLLSTGIYRTPTDRTYTASPVGSEGYVVLSWSTEEVLKQQSVLSAYSNKYEEAIIRVNLETGLIEDATNSDVIGRTCDSVVSLDELKRMTTDKATILKLADGTRTYGVVDDSIDGQLFCSYVNLSSVLPDVIRTIALPIVLGWVFLALLLLYVLRFSNFRQTKENISEDCDSRDREDSEYIHLFKNRYIDRQLYIHSVSIVTFAVVLIVVSLMYVQTLIKFSTQNIRANNNLETLESMINLNDENEFLMADDFKETRELLVNAIAAYYMRHPDQQNNESLIRMIAKMPYTSELSMYDDECTMEYGTDGNIGYSISKDSSKPESVCWDIISGNSNAITYKSDAGFEETLVVGRRQSEGGIIRIKSNSSFLSDFNMLTNVDNCVVTAYFGASDKAYIDPKSPSKLHWVSAGSTDCAVINNTLSDSVLQNGYAGITRIEGSNYYVNTRHADNIDCVLVSARLLKELIGIDNWKSIFFIVIALLLQQIILITSSAEELDEVPKKKKIKADNRFIRVELGESLMNEAFRTTTRNMLIITCLMIAFLLGFDSLYGKTSLLSYLFQSDWKKGFNLFSVTMILILSAGVIVAGAILQSLIYLFTRNMGPRGVTIGRLMSSIIKFLMLIFVIASILIDLGVSSSALITGAGVAGVAISFCAQSTLNDFLSGFFIVFEGLFNIGDWITVNDFRGQVIEIGMRKTRLAKGENIYCVSNSELKDVTIMAKNGCGAVVDIDIAYKEDAEAVMELLRNNLDVYRKEIPTIYDGPYVDGIWELKDSGVGLRIWGLTSQEDASAAERKIMTITKRLFDANNITIPFPHLSVYMEDNKQEGKLDGNQSAKQGNESNN